MPVTLDKSLLLSSPQSPCLQDGRVGQRGQERAARGTCFPATLLRKHLVMSPGLRVPCQGLTWSVPLWLCPCFHLPLCPLCLLPIPCLALALCLLGWGLRVLSLRSPPGLDPCLWDPLTSPITGQEEGGPTVSSEPHAAKSCLVHCEGPGCLLRGWRAPIHLSFTCSLIGSFNKPLLSACCEPGMCRGQPWPCCAREGRPGSRGETSAGRPS